MDLCSDMSIGFILQSEWHCLLQTPPCVVVQPNLGLSSSLSLILLKSGRWKSESIPMLQRWPKQRGGCTLGVLLQLRPQLWLTLPFQLWKLYSAPCICHLMSWVLLQACLWLEFICTDKSSGWYWSLICEPICLFTFHLCLARQLEAGRLWLWEGKLLPCLQQE